jgi:hypothetical protein
MEKRMTHEEIEDALWILIRREKPSIGAITLWLKLHPPGQGLDEADPFAAFNPPLQNRP